MIKTVSRMMITAAAAALVLAPTAAQAGTRASDSGTIYSAPTSAPGIGRQEEGESIASGFTILVSFLAAAAISAGAGVFLASVSGGGEGQSPGT